MFLHEGDSVIAIGTWQSFSVHAGTPTQNEFDDSLPYKEYPLDAGILSTLLQVLSTTSLPWTPAKPIPPSFGATFHGIRVEWSEVTTERQWLGKTEDIDEVSLRLWNLADSLVPTE